MTNIAVMLAMLGLVTAAGFLACLVWRRRLRVSEVIGVGFLGNIVASGARSFVKIPPIREIGVADPLLWMTAGSALVLLGERIARVAIRRFLSGAGREGPPTCR